MLIHIILVGVVTRNVVQTDIGPYVESISGLLVVAVSDAIPYGTKYFTVIKQIPLIRS